MDEMDKMDAKGETGTAVGTQRWTWRVVHVVTLAAISGALFLSRRYALVLLGGTGSVLVVASLTAPPREKSLFAGSVVVGLLGGLAFGVTFVVLGLAQAEMPLSHAALTLLPFLAACAVISLGDLLWAVVRRNASQESGLSTGSTDLLPLVLGMVLGVGAALLGAGYLAIPIELF